MKFKIGDKVINTSTGEVGRVTNYCWDMSSCLALFYDYELMLRENQLEPVINKDHEMQFKVGDHVKTVDFEHTGVVVNITHSNGIPRYEVRHDFDATITYYGKHLRKHSNPFDIKIGDYVRNKYNSVQGQVDDINKNKCRVTFSDGSGVSYYYPITDFELVENPESNEKQSDTVVTLDDHRKVTTKEVVTKTQVEEKSEYPKLMRYKYGKDSFIVLFRDHGCGIVVNSSDPTYKVGDYDVDWIMEHFKDHDEEITLKNK